MALPEGLSIGDLAGLRRAMEAGRRCPATAFGDSRTIDPTDLFVARSHKFRRTSARFPEDHHSCINLHGDTWTQGSTHVRAVEPTPMRGSSKVKARSKGVGDPLARKDRRV